MRNKKVCFIIILTIGAFYFSTYEYNNKIKSYSVIKEPLEGYKDNILNTGDEKSENQPEKESEKTDKEKIIDNLIDKPEFQEIFQYKSIPEEIKEKIVGCSWREGSPVKINSLKYLTITYYGFDDKAHLGELILNESVASEVVEIFKELYNIKYPIHKIKLIDDYGGSDELSMKDYNSSAFCYREIIDSKKISKHAYGLAIDINPVENPYVKGKEILPDIGKEFIDRANIRKGMITKEDPCYKAFKKRGWSWGGDWTSLKDYQHFEK
jgi:hypothetical protein